MKEEPFRHVDRPYPLEVVEREEAQNEEGAERPTPFHPTFLKMIGSD